MGIRTVDLIGYGFYSFLLAVLILSISLFLFYLRMSDQLRRISRRELTWLLWSIHIIIYLSITAVIARWGYEWIAQLIEKGDLFLSQSADGARIVYETRTILGYSETITMASIAIFLPLLVLLWSKSKEIISSRLDQLLSLRNNSNALKVSPQDLEDSIQSAWKDLQTLMEIGKDFRPIFWLTIVITFFLLLSLAYANFTLLGSLESYLLAALLKPAALALLLWYLMLLSIYQTSVQPLVRAYRHLHLFGLKNLT